MPPAARRRTALAVAGLAALALGGCTAWRLNEARALAKASEPAEQRPPSPAARLLVVGDSTGVGTGASDPRFSVAGRIAAEHPRLEVLNRARDGAKFAEVPAQLAAADGDFDVVLIQAGGNDVIRGTGADALRADVERALAAAAARAAHVVVVPPGNVGNAPFFVPPLSWWMTRRAQAMHAGVRAASADRGAHYVNLYRPRQEDPFVIDKALNARDGLHPSDAGYAVWWQALRAQTPLERWIALAR